MKLFVEGLPSVLFCAPTSNLQCFRTVHFFLVSAEGIYLCIAEMQAKHWSICFILCVKFIVW